MADLLRRCELCRRPVEPSYPCPDCDHLTNFRQEEDSRVATSYTIDGQAVTSETVPIRACASCGRDASRVDLATLNCVHCGGNPFVAPAARAEYPATLDPEAIEWMNAPAGPLPASSTGAGTLPTTGAPRQWSTGSRRDSRAGKGRYDLLPWSMVKRWALRMEAGAEHYGPRNWEKGQPLDSYFDSAIRHLQAWMAGDTSEDHLAAALFNVAALGWTEEQIDAGNLPEDLRKG